MGERVSVNGVGKAGMKRGVRRVGWRREHGEYFKAWLICRV
ncbi:hypothetical protein [Bartonella sp. CM120XJJH]